MNLKDKLIQAFQEAENTLSFHQERKESIDRLEEFGFPTVKDEEWKYTNLLPIIKNEYALSAQESIVSKELLNEYILTQTETNIIVFVNGKLNRELSDIDAANATICSLSEAEKNHSAVVKKYWGKALPENPDSLVSLNTALSSEGVFIHVPKGTVVEKPIQIVYFSTNVSSDLFLQTRNLIVIEENAQVQVTERHQNIDQKEVFTNSVTEIFAHDNSLIDFYKIQNDKRNCSLIDNTWVKQGKNCTCTVDTFSFGGKFIRNNLSFILDGQHSESNMRGITLIGENQLVDHHTLVDHAVPNCQSNEMYKGIFDDNAKGVFNGKVMVRPDAQKTNAFQSNNNLLLTDSASIDTKPQLEIYADDVACSHGCTVGQLDDDALFYLRSRGIPYKEAQAMLMYAFANDVLSNVKIPELKQKINRIIAEKLGVQIYIEV
ncbi:Fe-S cluster assembly protein SufD [Flavobacteriales bacterium]|nr:Fe-S cluster assembly protein SufD [Flavobacteriales bacterium]